MAIKFNQIVKHGTQTLYPGVAFAFDDTNAENYFLKLGWAHKTKEDPICTFPVGEIEIDPQTVHGHGPAVGQLVLEPSEA